MKLSKTMKLSKANQAHLLAALGAYQEATVLQGWAWAAYLEATARHGEVWEGPREEAWTRYQEALFVAAGLMMNLRFDIKGW